MTDQHPIVPPLELREQWYASADGNSEDVIEVVANQAGRWGADQELEACCKWVSLNCPYFGDYPMPEDKLRTARRPKPPSLKEQALALLQPGEPRLFNSEMQDTIRRALEAQP